MTPMTGDTDDRYALAHSVNNRRWHLMVNVVAGWQLFGTGARQSIYRRHGIDARAARFLPGCFFYGHDVSVGEGTWISNRCFFDTRAPITIGRNCDIGVDTVFCTSTHEVGDQSRRAGEYVTAPVTIGDGCWVGHRVTFLPGVTVGAGCVIGAGAVVIADCEPNSIYAGVPAKLIRRIEDE